MAALVEERLDQQNGFVDAVDEVHRLDAHLEVAGLHTRGAGQVVGQCLEPAGAALGAVDEPQRRAWLEVVEVLDEHVQTEAQAGERITQLVGDGRQQV